MLNIELLRQQELPLLLKEMRSELYRWKKQEAAAQDRGDYEAAALIRKSINRLKILYKKAKGEK